MSDIQTTRPVIRLKPKADARALRHGAPWVYADDLVLDRRTKALAPGSIAVLEDAERQPLALVAFNPLSKIAARVLDRDLAAEIDQAWFSERIARALALRTRLFAEPFYRLIHAEADGLPGVVADRFGEVIVVQPNAAWADQRMAALGQALGQIPGVRTVLKNASGRARALEGLDDQAELLQGDMPGAPITVPMNGATYLADLVAGQKTGLFFDQRDNQAFVASLSKGARVLDLFSHVGGFALAALAAGAETALAVDSSQPALDLAAQGAALSGVADRFTAERAEAFEAMERLAAEGARFDVVIADPPAFAPNRAALEKGLRAYERTARLASSLVAEGGILCLCSCSHAADLTRFRGASIRGIGRAGREGRLIRTGFAAADHPMHSQLAESGYLKSLTFAL